MKKLDYLKLIINKDICYSIEWLISAFAIVKSNTSENTYGKLIQEPWGFSFFAYETNTEPKLVKIDDSVKGEPLFTFKEKINIDSTWLPNLDSEIETTVGNLLFNKLCLVYSFGSKFKYVNKKITVEELEDQIALKLKDTPLKESDRSNQYFYVDEYIKFSDSLQTLSTLSQLCAWSATPKGIVAPTGIREFKQNLIKKYDGTLTDPVALASFEGELKKFDDEYLKDDPAYGSFISGKVKNIARKKMFLNLGVDARFETSVKITPVINSLDEGWPTDPIQYTAMMNGLRAGSFSRGSETVKGGVSAKILLRADNKFKIIDTDCGSKLGLSRLYTLKDRPQLLNRYVIENGSNVAMTEENVDSYLGKVLSVRTPIYCKLSGDNLCKHCAGLKLFKFPTGLTIPLTEISAIILTASLKKMHGTVLATSKLNLAKALS